MEKSVLLVDDKQEIAKIIMLYLSSTYKVSYKENPLKAIAWLQEGNLPDLIISDLNMPEMSGEEFLVYLKANDMFSHIPVLILSMKGLYFRYSANLFWFSLRTMYEASSVGLKAVRMRLMEVLLSPI